MLQAMQSRYTVKKYSNQEVSHQDIEELKEILRLSPSSINAQPWRFVFVQDQIKKEQFAQESKFNEPKIVNCDTLVIFQTKTDEKFANDAPSYLSERIFEYYKQEVKKRKGGYEAWAQRQAYIAMGVLLAACATKGIGSTPMEGINPEGYDKIIGDEGYKTIAAVSIGVPAEDDPNRPDETPKQRLPLSEVIKEM